MLLERIKNSLHVRLIFSIALIIFSFIALALGSFFYVQRQMNLLQRTLEDTSDEILLIDMVHHSFHNMFDNYRLYIDEPDTESRQNVIKTIEEMDGEFGRLGEKNFTLANERRLAKEISADWKKFRRILMVKLGDDIPVEVSQQDEFISQRITEKLIKLMTITRKETFDLMKRIRRLQIEQVEFGIVLSLFSIFAISLGVTIVARSVIKPLDVFTVGASRWADGDFSYRIKIDRRDEFGRLAEVFNNMAAKLEKTYARLEIESTYDGLTNVFNRKEFYRLLRKEILRSNRYNRRFSLMMVDIDNFKEINDKYGHQAGDKVLYFAAQLMKRSIRPMDQVARVGGDEFIVILPETDCSHAKVIARRLLEAFGSRNFYIDINRFVGLSISVGIAGFPEDADEEEKIIAAADQAMYAAKNFGRGNLICYREVA